jgi:hypothetical protein
VVSGQGAGAGQSKDRPGSGSCVVVDGCDDPILLIHEASVDLLQLPAARGLHLTLGLQSLMSL